MGSSIKINKIEEIRSWGATEDYYQYSYQDNNIIGYEIFRADLDIKTDLDNQKREYKLTKSFLINP
jgi:hypothetical protein